MSSAAAAMYCRGRLVGSLDVSEVVLEAGATADDIVGILIAVAPISGLARAILATPDVALPIGYDIDAAFEELAPDSPPCLGLRRSSPAARRRGRPAPR
jgi:hypothetical protein